MRPQLIEHLPLSFGIAAPRTIEGDPDDKTRVGKDEGDLIFGTQLPIEVLIDPGCMELMRIQKVRDGKRTTVTGGGVVGDQWVVGYVGRECGRELFRDQIGFHDGFDEPMLGVHLVPGHPIGRYQGRKDLYRVMSKGVEVSELGERSDSS